MGHRPSKDDYYLGIAAQVAARSTCLRRQYGAVIVKDDVIISTGYNGSPRGEKNCCDVGVCWREAHNIPHGEQYEKCVAVHAEANAIISCNRDEMIGSTLYLAGFEDGKPIVKPEPCAMCARLIMNARIACVVSGRDDMKSIEMISACGYRAKIDGYRCICGSDHVVFSDRVSVYDHDDKNILAVNQMYCTKCGIMMRSPESDTNGEWLKEHWKEVHMKDEHNK